MADGTAVARRSQRPRSGLAICDEALLFELHSELMQKEAPNSKRKAEGRKSGAGLAGGGAAAQSEGLLPSASGAAQANGGASGSGEAEERAAKRAKAAGGSDGLSDVPPVEDIDFAAGQPTAWACGLSFDSLSEDEKGLLPHGANVQEYAKVRNAVLTMWRKDVSTKLPLAKVLASVKPKDQPYALAAWRFLKTLGYIDYGVCPELQSDVKTTPGTRGSVIVVGSGCAGLAAARQLRCWGYRVTVLEGRDRAGGRVYTERLTDPAGNNSVVADVGGSILTGIDGNPLSVVAKQLQMPLAHIRDRTPLYMADGSPADPVLDSTVESYYNDVLMKGCNGVRKNPEEVKNMSLLGALEKLWDENYSDLEKGLPRNHGSAPLQDRRAQLRDLKPAERAARQMFDWHIANLEFANACRLEECSLLHWDQDDPNELPGPHCFVPGCNGRWLRALVENVAVHYNSPVSEIRYAQSGVAVSTPKKVFHADAVVVTVPLGVLKRGGIAFNPPLSDRKQSAISRLGFGNLNKVIIMFPRVFWSEEEDMFGHVSQDSATRGEAFLFYSYAKISGGAQLTALVAGGAADEQEKRPAAESAARVISVLRKIFEPKGIEVPAPLQVLVTRWGSDPMTYGAYSSMRVGGKGGVDYDILSENVGGRLFFAGEATTKRYPATMHGAFFTGLWTAGEVDAALCKSKGMPQVGTAEAAAAIRDIESANAAKEAAVAAAHSLGRREKAAAAQALSQKTETVTNGTSNGNGNAAKAKGQSRPEPPRFSAGPAAPPLPKSSAVPGFRPDYAKCLEDKVSRFSKLKMLFDDPMHPPDLDVSGYKVVFGAPGSGVAHLGLLRMDMTFLKGGRPVQHSSDSAVSMKIYCVILKDTASALAGLPDNLYRMNMLTCLPTAKYVGRDELPEDAMKIAESVMRWRRRQVAPAAKKPAEVKGNYQGNGQQDGDAGPSSHHAAAGAAAGHAAGWAHDASAKRAPTPPAAPIPAPDPAPAAAVPPASFNNRDQGSLALAMATAAEEVPPPAPVQQDMPPPPPAVANHPPPAAPAPSVSCFSTAALVLGIAASALSGELDMRDMPKE